MTALGSLLTSKDLDGMFIAAGISLPAATELIGDIPNIDPLLLHNVRWVFSALRQVNQTLAKHWLKQLWHDVRTDISLRSKCPALHLSNGMAEKYALISNLQSPI